MKDSMIEEIYYTLIGQMVPEYQVPGVADAFAPDSLCDEAWNTLTAARDRLLERLRVPEEDADLEILMDQYALIQKDLCLRMFRLGFAMGATSFEIRQKS